MSDGQLRNAIIITTILFFASLAAGWVGTAHSPAMGEDLMKLFEKEIAGQMNENNPYEMAVTLFTNANDGSGGDTLAIPAGLTVWNTNDIGANPFAYDVTKLFVHNASATTAVKVVIRALIDLS